MTVCAWCKCPVMEGRADLKFPPHRHDGQHWVCWIEKHFNAIGPKVCAWCGKRAAAWSHGGYWSCLSCEPIRIDGRLMTPEEAQINQYENDDLH